MSGSQRAAADSDAPPPRQTEILSRAPGRSLLSCCVPTCCARSLRTARGVSDIFRDEGKCPFRCALRAEDRASPQPVGDGQCTGACRSFCVRRRGAHPRTRYLGHFSRRRKVSVLMRTKGGAPVLPGREVQVSIPARGAARLFCPAYRLMKSVPGAALPPRSAPERNTLAARAKCPDHSVRRRTATRHPRAGPKRHPAPRTVCPPRGEAMRSSCARSLRTARGVSDIFHGDGKCPFRGALRAEGRASPRPGGGGQCAGI